MFTPVVFAVDHLLLGVSDLERGIDWTQKRTGIRATKGGSHPGVGTRNALLSLGARHYMEIIAPDLSQLAYNFQIDVRPLAEPRLVTYAASTSDIESTASLARRAGYRVLGPASGSRVLTSGETLRWRTLGVVNKLGSGGIEPVPFFIQWDPDTPHPSKSAPAGCELELLGFQHPNPSELSTVLSALGIDGTVSSGLVARIVATLKTPMGRLELS